MNQKMTVQYETPRRVQRRRTKGWRMPPNTVSVTRPGPLGNPFPANDDPATAVDRYRRWLKGEMTAAEFNEHATWTWRNGFTDREEILHRLPALRGKNLACFCGEGCPCHGDVVLEMANVPSSA